MKFSSSHKGYQVIALLGLSLIMLCGLGFYLLDQHYHKSAVKNAELQARRLTQLVDDARQQYGRLLEEMKGFYPFDTGYDHKLINGKLPTPATFSIELAQNSEGRVWMYSDYPFPWRKETAVPKSDYQRQALSQLIENPKSTYTHLIEGEDKIELFFARAIVMNEPSCIACHNSHPDSSRRDWKIGDTRAVLATRVPLTYHLNYSLYWLFLAAIALCLVITAMYFKKDIALLQSQLTARIDPLSKIANRVGLEESMRAIWTRQAARQEVMAILMIDIDNFKRINDTYGHDVGDKCIERAAAEITSAVRSDQDTVGRWGGEEFQVILSKTSKEQAMATAERILERISNIEVLPHGVKFTVSIGLKTFLPAANFEPDQYVEQADQFLLRAKREGKNRVVFA